MACKKHAVCEAFEQRWVTVLIGVSKRAAPRTYRAQRGGQDHSAQCDFRPHLISG